SITVQDTVVATTTL
nr:immunoglobulin heavy chain junction region [Mus musculus]